MGAQKGMTGLYVLAIVVIHSSSAFFVGDFTDPLRVAAFNIRRFGRGVMADSLVVSRLTSIFNRYDLVLVQEVRDGTNTALDDLKKSLTSFTGTAWNYTASEPIGRSKYYKEQYVFFYRESSVVSTGGYQVEDDAAGDVYEREPFASEFEYKSAKSNAKRRIVLMALHTRPTDTKAELQQLPATIRSVAPRFPQSNGGVIALGDMNADCTYLTGKWRSSLEVFNSTQFRSLIPDTADSTVLGTTHCAYDRVIVFGSWVDARDAKVFNFADQLSLNETEALDVSDHFPIEFQLY